MAVAEKSHRKSGLILHRVVSTPTMFLNVASTDNND